MTVTDQIDPGESPESTAADSERKRYARVVILDSGWIKCTRTNGGQSAERDEAALDYYPPQAVRDIHAVGEDTAGR
ncbi:hypothetical protein [Halorubrum lipolyticum]|uniref:hypothetical protein n=1 Tax=Halorubrum lipolyticum TaxID=368624 RepID=UPI0011C89E1A|nr:hypothetical protein [Halorubrum lipolyticum]